MYINDSSTSKSYLPGLERWSSYKTLWIRHWEGFKSTYKERFEAIYGPLTKEKKEEAEKLIRCGKFANGFRMHKCPTCGIVLAVPFTCKSRLCLSCYRKRLFGWSVNLSHIMNTNLSHIHVTLTLPGRLRNLLFERNFPAHELVTVAAFTLRGHIRDTAGLEGHDWTNGMIGTAHACGNSLNYNPHVHIVASRELINLRTGEIIDPQYIPYVTARIKWMKALLKMLVSKNYLSREEANGFFRQYPRGFHVHFKPILGNENDVLFKTAEYLAAGYFHNSRILEVNHSKKIISFRFRRLIDPHTKERLFATQTLPIYEFMARMLYYLPDHHRKIIRYYGIYARGVEHNLETIRKKTWAYAIEHCFEKDPATCPRCGAFMIEKVIYSFEAEKIAKKLTVTHYLYQGYFIPRHGP